jgi:hypothetical protein
VLRRRTFVVMLAGAVAAIRRRPMLAQDRPIRAVAGGTPTPTWFVDHDGWVIPGRDREALLASRAGEAGRGADDE